ncbi:MAG TPA: polysaccharide pyruvyl transferase CsaB, partial [Bacilli bacterium]
VVLSGNPPLTERLYGVKAVHRMKPRDIYSALKASDGLISGGGSLLQDETGVKTIPYYLGVIKFAQLLRKKVFIYAQGIGPIHRRIFFPFIRNSFNRCALITVRDAASAQLLGQIGIDEARVRVVPDPVMGFPLVEKAKTRTSADGAQPPERDIPIVGVSVRFWEPDRRDLAQIARALELVMRARPVRVVLLPFHSRTDTEAAQFVREQIADAYRGQIEIAAETAEPLAMVDKVADCDALLGMRLHSLIYAASQLVPFAAVSYDPKIDAFLNRLDMAPVGHTRALNPQDLADETLRLLANAASWRKEKQGAIAAMRAQSRIPAQQLLELLRI